MLNVGRETGNVGEREREGINCFDGGRSMHRACLSSRRVKDFRVVKRPCCFLG